MTAKNFLLGLLCLALLIGGFFAGRQLERRRCLGEAMEAAQGRSQEILSLRAQAEEWAAAISKAEGEALLRAFVSGISPSLLADRRDSLDISATGLLRVAGVSGVHILNPAGKVYYSSDAKLATTGELGEEGAWALTATDLISREGSPAGSRDYAVPVISTGKVIAVIWLEFADAAVRDAAKPAGLAGPISDSATKPNADPGATPDLGRTGNPGATADPGAPADPGATAAPETR